MDDATTRVARFARRRLRPGANGLVSTDVSAGRQTIDETADTRPLSRWERKALEQQHQAARAMSLLEQIAAHLGGLLAASKAVAPGDVLAQRTIIMPAGGVYELDVRGDPYQAVSLANLGTHLMTLVSQPAGAGAPAQGTGVAQVPANIWRTVAMRGTALTVYGTAGDTFDITLFARPRDQQAGNI